MAGRKRFSTTRNRSHPSVETIRVGAQPGTLSPPSIIHSRRAGAVFSTVPDAGDSAEPLNVAGALPDADGQCYLPHCAKNRDFSVQRSAPRD